MVSKVFVFLAAISALVNGAVVRKRAACPDGVHTAENPACCVWYAVRDDIQQNLLHSECEAETHEVLRATFHDAIGISQASGTGGGADGSLIAFGDSHEFAFPANAGLEDIAHELKKYADRHNVSYADIIQFAGAVGVTNCPGAPTIQTFVGRPNAVAASPPGVVPQPTDDVNDIIARFNDAGISTADMVWLLASHSIAAQRHVDPDLDGSPFDSTPGVFDTQIYLEVLLKGTEMNDEESIGEVLSPLVGEMRLKSDFEISRHPDVTCLWQLPLELDNFINNVFSLAMTNMGLLGQDRDQLTDCTEVIPTAQPLPKAVSFPAGKTSADLELPDVDCGIPLLPMSTDSGPQPTISPVAPPTF